MMRVAVSRLHFPVTTLGPGRRVGLWLQGCSIRCPGCISVDTWRSDAGLAPLSDVCESIMKVGGEADGLTVSGGEPFDQPEALAALLRFWRKMSPASVFVFTGREYGDVEPWLLSNPGLIDALMTGPFRLNAPQSRALRGSDNQVLHILTPLGQEFSAFERPLKPQDKRLDVMFDEAGDAWLAGIPARGDITRLRLALERSGTRAMTTSDRRGSFAS